jgi:NTE family protein
VSNQEEPYCLVLGGGGAKGVYHIGVWQALQELNIPVNAFIGNSIGAVISAFLAQGAASELIEIAKTMNIQSLIRLHKDKALTDEQSITDHSLSYWQGVYKNVVDKGGLDTTPMRTLLESALNEDALRASGVDFGITTVNVSDFKPREVFIENMELGQLINYVMASAAFPGFANPEIEGKKYIDGGLYDNVPYAMARRRGYRKIILVDISGIGMHRRAKTEGTQTVSIKNSIDMGNAFDFDPAFIEQFQHLGYLDAMRTFGELIGNQYFIQPNAAAEQRWQDLCDAPAQASVADLFPKEFKHNKRFGLKVLETCATILEIPRIQSYSYEALEQEIHRACKLIEADVELLLKERGLLADSKATKMLDAFTREVFEQKKLIHNDYYYVYLIAQFKPSSALKLAKSTLLKLTPELKVLELFLQVTSPSGE